MGDTIKARKGLKANIDHLLLGEFGFTTDEERVYIGGNNGNIPLPNATDLSENTHELKLVTRDGQTAGIQTISGLRKLPKYINVVANVVGTVGFSNGVYCIDGGQQTTYQYNTGLFSTLNGSAIVIANGGGDSLTGTIQNIQNGSFDISWTKTGVGVAGAIKLEIVCVYR